MGDPVPTPLSEPPVPDAGRPGLAQPLRRSEACLRLSLGLGWLALAGACPGAEDVTAAPVLRLGLAACGLLAFLGFSPRGSTVLGLLLAGLVVRGSGGAPLWAGVVLAGTAGARLLLWLGEAAPWLTEIRHLERSRFCALTATQLARARAARSGGVGRGALEDAGDAYERAGQLRSELRGMGVEPARVTGLAWAMGAGLGWILRAAPRLSRPLEAWLMRQAGLLGPREAGSA